MPTSAFAALCLALPFAALDLFTFLDSQCGAGTGTTASADEAPLLEVMLMLAALGLLFVAVAFIYHNLKVRRVVAVPVAGAGAAGNGRRSIPGLLVFLLCVSAGTIELVIFGQDAGGGGGAAGHGAQARALGLAALRALPAAATATFFLGMTLIIVAHVCAGGEGGGGGAVAADGPIQGLLRLLTDVAAGVAAALVGLMVMALTLCGASKY